MAPPLNFQEAVARVQFGNEDVQTVVEALLAQLSKDEKLALLDGDSSFWKGLRDLYTGFYSKEPYRHGEIRRLKIPGVRYCDGPRGININKATAFPVPMARGATWNTALEERVAYAIGLEARAYGANTCGSVCINLPRHPAWGRVQETYSEESLVLGELGAAHVRGLQKNVIACVKHFALNSMETARFRVDVTIDEASLHELYMPHFERCIEEGALSIMTAYNSVNGEWAGQSKKLITDVLLKELNFKGFTISDWLFGVRDGVKSIKAGLDIEAPFQNLRSRFAKAALESGELSWSDIDPIARRILSAQVQHYAAREKEDPKVDVVLSQRHRDLAREAATQSIVLLKNELMGGVPLLPLSSALPTCAVVGRLANTAITGDGASSLVDCPDILTPYEGLKEALPKTSFILSDSDSASAAVAAARIADVAILIVGYNHQDEGEYLRPDKEKHASAFAIYPPPDDPPAAQTVKSISLASALPSSSSSPQPRPVKHGDLASRPTGGDRRSVRLRTADVQLIRAVTSVNPRTIVSIVTAGAIIIEEWRALAPSILVGWYNGCEGGRALASVLLGEANPSGRLPWSLARDESHLPPFDADANSVVYDKWVGQRRLDRIGVTAAYPLGFGLSYTEFRVESAEIEELYPEGDTVGQCQQHRLKAVVRVTNKGDRDGRCVVQVYGQARYQSNSANGDMPKRVLTGFESVEVAAGSSSVVEVPVSLKPFRQWVDGSGFVSEFSNISFEVGQFAGDPNALIRPYATSLKARV